MSQPQPWCFAEVVEGEKGEVAGCGRAGAHPVLVMGPGLSCPVVEGAPPAPGDAAVELPVLFQVIPVDHF